MYAATWKGVFYFLNIIIPLHVMLQILRRTRHVIFVRPERYV